MSKDRAFSHGDIEQVSDKMTVDRCRVSNVRKQYKKRTERKKGIKFESGPKELTGRKKVDTKNAKKQFQETPLTLSATLRCKAAASSILESKQHKYMEIFGLRVLSRVLKLVLTRRNIKNK